MTFADSSALVKLYADEPGCLEVRAVEVFIVSAVARVEVPAALWRKVRTGELVAEQAGLLSRAFEADWYAEQPEEPRFVSVSMSTVVIEAAARLTVVHALRAYDAVQLASAVLAREAAGAIDTVACFDRGLRAAAAAEGFRLAPA